MKICVVGYGTVGKAIVAGLDKSDELDYDIVDPAYKEYNQDLKEVMESCDSAIICVPTPQDEDGYLDDSQVFDIVETIGYEKPILIKSTIAIDSCVYFRDSNRNVCFSPEFLRAETAVEDFLSETKLIISLAFEEAIYAFFFILNIIAAGTIAAGHLKTKFLFIEISPGQLQAHHTYQDNSPTLAGHVSGLTNRFATRGGGSDQHTIDTTSTRPIHGMGNRITSGGKIDDIGPKRFCQSTFGRVEINTQHPTPIGPQHLHAQ